MTHHQHARLGQQLWTSKEKTGGAECGKGLRFVYLGFS